MHRGTIIGLKNMGFNPAIQRCIKASGFRVVLVGKRAFSLTVFLLQKHVICYCTKFFSAAALLLQFPPEDRGTEITDRAEFSFPVANRFGENFVIWRIKFAVFFFFFCGNERTFEPTKTFELFDVPFGSALGTILVRETFPGI